MLPRKAEACTDFRLHERVGSVPAGLAQNSPQPPLVRACFMAPAGSRVNVRLYWLEGRQMRLKPPRRRVMAKLRDDRSKTRIGGMSVQVT